VLLIAVGEPGVGTACIQAPYDGVMTRPTPSAPRAQQQVAVSGAFAGAIDLSALAARPPAGGPSGPGGSAPVTGPESAPPAPSSTSPYVLDITEQTFPEIIEASSQVLVVIDLWATWCEPCKQLSPVLERLAETAGGSWILGKVDVDANPRIAQAFGVQSIPTVVAIAAGQPLDAFAGALPEPQVRQWISGLLDSLRDTLPGIRAAEEANGGPAPEPEDPRFTAAEDLMSEEKYEQAAAAYQKILDSEPANVQAAAALETAKFLARVQRLPSDAVEKAAAAPDDSQAQRDAADVELAAGNAGAAFDRLVDAIRRSGPDQRAVLREHLISLFAMFQVDDAQVVAARRALAAALY